MNINAVPDSSLWKWLFLSILRPERRPPNWMPVTSLGVPESTSWPWWIGSQGGSTSSLMPLCWEPWPISWSLPCPLQAPPLGWAPPLTPSPPGEGLAMGEGGRWVLWEKRCQLQPLLGSHPPSHRLSTAADHTRTRSPALGQETCVVLPSHL